jgi:thiamine-monophosphate kinase
MHLGYKAVVVNLSDIYAMNAHPSQITVSLGISNRFSVEAIDEIYKGIQKACDFYKVDLIGGDTTASSSGLVISITAIGQAKKDQIVFRNGAKKGDIICVSGDLGASYLGLQIFNREKQVYMEDPNFQPELAGNDYLIGRLLKPEARRDVIEWLKTNEIKPTSMMDISDGLSSELLHICTQSGVGALIEEFALPIAEISYNRAVDFNIPPTTCALNGGEDYELLFTIDPTYFETIENSGTDIRIIGEIKDPSEGVHLLTKGNQMIALKAQGWNSLNGK